MVELSVAFRTDSAEDVIMVRQMSLAVLAAIDARRIEVDVVGKTHGDGSEALHCRVSAFLRVLIRVRAWPLPAGWPWCGPGYGRRAADK